jgi:hypothetical protein
LAGPLRKNPDLGDAIDALDFRLVEDAKGDLSKAFEMLTSTELEFISGEVEKCLASPRYFLENYYFIKTKKLELKPVWPFWDSQEKFLEIFERQHRLSGTIRIVVLKARQLGLTTLSVALMAWLVFFFPMAHVLTMADEEERTNVNFVMARTAHEYLPWWMRPEKRYDAFGKRLGFDRARADDRAGSQGMQSQIYFESANQPSGAAYSKSLFGVHLAEVARFRNDDAITEGIYGSLAELPGTIGIMESTARGRGNLWNRICKNSETGDLPWEFLFIEWFREPGYSIAVPENFKHTTEEDALIKKVQHKSKVTLTDGQLSWRRKKMREYEYTTGDSEKFRQEYPINPVEAFVASGITAFSKKRMQEMITHFCKPEIWRGEIELNKDDKTFRIAKVSDGRMRVWEFPKASMTYYIAADPSMGIERGSQKGVKNGDPGCIEVMAVPEDINQPLRQVARWHGYIGPGKFARILAAMGYMYNTAEIAPECNNITTVASDLVKVLLYPKWYRWMREDKAKNAFSNFIGWLTTFRNKNELISRFRQALNEWTVIIRCEEDMGEMFDFVEVEEGSETFAAKNGTHDDATMALMICYYCATQLRPRMDSSLEEKKPSKDVDFQNTDYSLMYDKDSQNTDSGNPDFFML